MSDLTYIEKSKFEKLFGMSSGYVLDFINRTFSEFVLDSTGKDIYSSRYEYASGSKANRLRAFWNQEPNHVVGKLMSDLLEYYSELGGEPKAKVLFENCSEIVKRLLQGAPVPDIDAIEPNAGGRSFERLAQSVRDAIDRNEPEEGLDRLHTFVVKYLRVICEKHGISTERGKPLHSLMGEYIKYLKQEGLIESQMTDRILKSSISTMEAFNLVRNEQSLAHDNPILGYDESLLIFNHVASAIRFVTVIEDRAEEDEGPVDHIEDEEDDIPF